MSPGEIQMALTLVVSLLEDTPERRSDERMRQLRRMVQGPARSERDCAKCGLEGRNMFWHPADRRDHCPRCEAPLLEPREPGPVVSQDSKGGQQ